MSAPAYDRSARKRPTNLSVNEDLLRKARGLGINLSQAFEQQLEELVRTAEARRWEQENRDAIAAHNRFVALHGTFGDRHRKF